jgi:hypothetical protein
MASQADLEIVGDEMVCIISDNRQWWSSTLCFLCEGAEGLTKFFRGRPLHDECGNAVRSYVTAIRMFPAAVAKEKLDFDTNPPTEWRTRIFPYAHGNRRIAIDATKAQLEAESYTDTSKISDDKEMTKYQYKRHRQEESDVESEECDGEFKELYKAKGFLNDRKKPCVLVHVGTIHRSQTGVRGSEVRRRTGGTDDTPLVPSNFPMAADRRVSPHVGTASMPSTLYRHSTGSKGQGICEPFLDSQSPPEIQISETFHSRFDSQERMSCSSVLVVAHRLSIVTCWICGTVRSRPMLGPKGCHIGPTQGLRAPYWIHEGRYGSKLYIWAPIYDSLDSKYISVHIG